MVSYYGVSVKRLILKKADCILADCQKAICKKAVCNKAESSKRLNEKKTIFMIYFLKLGRYPFVLTFNLNHIS